MLLFPCFGKYEECTNMFGINSYRNSGFNNQTFKKSPKIDLAAPPDSILEMLRSGKITEASLRQAINNERARLQRTPDSVREGALNKLQGLLRENRIRI